MGIWTSRAAVLLAAVSLAACGDVLPAGQGGPTRTAASTGGATVSGRVAQLRSDQQALSNAIAAQSAHLESLRNALANEARSYNAAVSHIAARLQAGTTPANPELVGRWNEAQGHLDKVTADLGQLNSLAVQVTTQATVAGNVLDTVRATYAVGGAVDEDHRQLRAIEGETNRAMQDIDRLIGDLNGEITRQNNFLMAERASLAGLSYAVNAGRMVAPPGR